MAEHRDLVFRKFPRFCFRTSDATSFESAGAVVSPDDVDEFVADCNNVELSSRVRVDLRRASSTDSYMFSGVGEGEEASSMTLLLPLLLLLLALVWWEQEEEEDSDGVSSD